MKNAYHVSFTYASSRYLRIVRADNTYAAIDIVTRVIKEATHIKVRIASDQEVNDLPPLSKDDGDALMEAAARAHAWKPNMK